MIYLEAFYMGIAMLFLHIKHKRKNNNSQKGRSWGAGFCTWMFQYIWVVIIISNALLFNCNDWLTTFVWPLHPLVCFTLSSASPFHAANNAYNHTCLGPHREKQTKPGKLKETKAKPKKQTFERMFGFDSKAYCFPYFFLKWKHKKTSFFLNGYDQSRYQKNKKLKLFLFFQHFRFGFLHWKVSKTKKMFFFLMISWLIISIQKKISGFLFFHFKTKKNKHNLGKTPKKHLLSQNQTFSQKFFFGSARVLWFFWFVMFVQTDLLRAHKLG